MAVAVSPYRTSAPGLADEVEIAAAPPAPPVDDDLAQSYAWDSDCETEPAPPTIGAKAFLIALSLVIGTAAVIACGAFLMRASPASHVDRTQLDASMTHMNLRTVNR